MTNTNRNDIEIELKFEVDEEFAAELHRRYSFGDYLYQLTVMFDKENELQGVDARLRLRKTGELVTLDYKKPLSRFGVKQELEKTIRVDSFENAEAILRLLNYFPVSSYEKYRARKEIDGQEVAIDKYPFAVFVEIEGETGPVPSCTVAVRDGMTIRTDTPAVRQLQRTGLEFLLSTHDLSCKECPANKQCALQRIAKFLKVRLRPKHLEQHLKEPRVDESHPVFNYYPNRCVLCGRCIHVCRETHGKALLTFAKRGIGTVISFYGEEDVSRLPGEKCQACVDICPVRAITLKASEVTEPSS